MNRMTFCSFVAVLFILTSGARAQDPLVDGWNHPPMEGRIRAYWWWLNGNVTKEAITRDLEEMKAKGFGGALICDAGGASQDGNDPVPHGVSFLSPEWRALYKYTLREANRLGLEMSLNIQSGWNLGGPMVTADDAAKKMVWSESLVKGPGKIDRKLAEPAGRDGYYRDSFIVAYRVKPEDGAQSVFAGLKSCSEQPGRPLAYLADGDTNTFWISTTGKLRVGPSRKTPAWVQFEFLEPTEINRLTIQPRPGYGPKECELQVSDDGKAFRVIKEFVADKNRETTVTFAPVSGSLFRLLIVGAFDRSSPQAPRNCQIAEVRLSGKNGSWPDRVVKARRLQHWEEKAGHKPLHFSAPDTTLLLDELPDQPGEEETRPADVVDLTGKLAADGTLRWDAPAGVWRVLRFGCTIGNHSYVSTSSDNWKGYAIDVLDAGAFRRYWDAVVEPLLDDAGPLAGKTLKYLHTDSWEVEPLNWTPTLRAEFQKRRGYDLLPWLPALAGKIVGSRSASHRFLHDFRKTIGDLAIDNHYRLFRDGAHRRGMLIHPESGGPHAVPIDAQRCLGFNDAPMSEFWAWSWRHRIGDSNRFFVKQPASAAHTYGRRLVLAEGFTTIGPHWQETIWDNLKPSFNKACCEGLNLLVWHEFVCSPKEFGLPGIQYFAGTHINPNTTWWPMGGAFFAYLNRCQFLLQQGLFVADVAYYYGDHVPNFAQHKRTDPARVLPGYDYDVITEEALLTRASVKDGRIVLPDGMSYRALVLRENKAISVAALRKIAELVKAGATVIGPKPSCGMGLRDDDAEIKRIAGELWDSGRIITGKTAREVLLAAGVKPDFEFEAESPSADLDYIHRREGGAEIYFVANLSNSVTRARCTFRAAGTKPELWDPVTGERRGAATFARKEGRTTLPLEFAPYGSVFVVFRKGTAKDTENVPKFKTVAELTGAWEVTFGEKKLRFEELADWTTVPEVRHFSGMAVYRKTFEATGRTKRLFLDLGGVSLMAGVRLNGQDLGVVWCPPWRVEITDAVKASGNLLEITVVNSWFNQLVGDPNRERTKTNIRVKPGSEPQESGLFGPVTLRERS